MNKYLKIILSVFIGGSMAFGLCFGIFKLVSTVRSDHAQLQQVVQFLNKAIEASQTQK